MPEREEGQQFVSAPSGPRVLPGTYTVQLEAAGQTLSTELRVRLDPRVQISRADLEARQRALMSMYALAKPLYEAGRAVRELNQQLAAIQQMLRDIEDAPQSLGDEATAISGELGAVSRELNQVNRNARAGSAIEASTTRPTADQEWQIDQAWEQVPDLITRLNDVITNRMPALYSQLDEHGIRPSVGEAIEVPSRPGR